MKKQFFTILGIVVIAGIALFAVLHAMHHKTEPAQTAPQVEGKTDGKESAPSTAPADVKKGTSYKDATYLIDGEYVTLVNGAAETEAAPGSASKIVTKYFGDELKHDIDGDGREDTVFILTQQTGGTGTFYYVVAGLNTEGGYVGTRGFALGDRIAPQSVEIASGDVVLVNYSDRKEGQSFDVAPSVGKSVWLFLDRVGVQFANVGPDFKQKRVREGIQVQVFPWSVKIHVRKPYSPFLEVLYYV